MVTSSRRNADSTSQLSLFLLLLSLYTVHCNLSIENSHSSTYRVAVLEHDAIYPKENVINRDMALEAMAKNIQIYNETIIEARKKGVKLITFPEYGICNRFMTRQRTSLYAETIPDSKSRIRNPCEDPEFRGKTTEVQRVFSCIARHNEMFLVVNMIARETCNKNETACPPDRQYLYNANVVFSPKGEIVARYYKRHLFIERTINPAKSAEIAIFDTPFGKFATFICFDVVFEKPFIELIEKHDIRNIALPTAWVEHLPFARAIQTHPSFARGLRINLLAANLHWKPAKSFGSGIYSPEGALNYYFNPDVPGNKLVIADLHQINKVRFEAFDTRFVSQSVTEKRDPIDVFKKLIPFRYKKLRSRYGPVTVCQGSICCTASYVVKRSFRDTYAVGVFQGYLQITDNEMAVEICILLKCPKGACGMEITSAKTHFRHFSLRGFGFASKYVYPSVLAIDRYQLMLVPKTWEYSEKNGIQSKQKWNRVLHTACYAGRVYSKDVLPKTTQLHSNNKERKTRLDMELNILLEYLSSKKV